MRTAIRREISSSSASMSAAVPRYRSEIIFGRPSTQPISRRYQYGFPLITFLYRLAISLGHRIFRGKRQGDTPDCRRPGLTGDVRQLIKIEIARKLGLVAADGGKPCFLAGHVLVGEDGSQLARDAVRIPVEQRLEVTPGRAGRVAGQLALQFGAPLAGGLPAGGLRAGDKYACGKCHGNSSAAAASEPIQHSAGKAGLNAARTPADGQHVRRDGLPDRHPGPDARVPAVFHAPPPPSAPGADRAGRRRGDSAWRLSSVAEPARN